MPVSAAPTGARGFFRISGLTPFLSAAETGNIPMMKLLIELGAIEAKNPDGPAAVPAGRTSSRKSAAVKFVVEELGLDVNEVRKGAGNALHTACRFGANDIVRYLVEKGIDLTVKDRFGRTPMEEAEFEAPKPTLELMKKLVATRVAGQS